MPLGGSYTLSTPFVRRGNSSSEQLVDREGHRVRAWIGIWDFLTPHLWLSLDHAVLMEDLLSRLCSVWKRHEFVESP